MPTMDDQQRAAFRAAISAVIRVEVARRQTSLKALARETGISTGSVSNYNTGLSEPRLSDASVIAEALGMDLAQFCHLILVELERGTRAAPQPDA